MQNKHIILFDMDNTLVSANTIELWNAFLNAKGVLSADQNRQWRCFHEDYVLGKLDVAASYEFELSVFKSIPLACRTLWLDEFFRDSVQNKISRSGLGLIAHYQRQPETLVVLITASVDFIARPVALYSQVDALIATTPEFDGQDYTGKLLGVPSLGKGKVQKFQEWLTERYIQPMHTVLYSDSINDLPLLEYVQTPVVVDPDPVLEQVAQQKGWKIVSFREADVPSLHPETIKT